MSATPNTISVMSFNIRYGPANDGVNRWDKRKSLVIDRIRAFDPDLIGMQECVEGDQAEFVKGNLPDYHFYGVRREGAQSPTEMAPLLFRKSRFQFVRSGIFWLSLTPDAVGSMGWDAIFARTATWAELIDNLSGQGLIFLNTHFDYQPKAIDGAATLLREWVGQNAAQSPVIITGDFNADKRSAAHAELTTRAGLVDADQQAHPGKDDTGTFHDYGRASATSAIDWILISPHFGVVSATVDRTHKGKVYPSDHYPITATLGLNTEA